MVGCLVVAATAFAGAPSFTAIKSAAKVKNKPKNVVVCIMLSYEFLVSTIFLYSSKVVLYI